MNTKTATITEHVNGYIIRGYNDHTFETVDRATVKKQTHESYKAAHDWIKRIFTQSQKLEAIEIDDPDDIELLPDPPIDSLEHMLFNTDERLLTITIDQVAEAELDRDERTCHRTEREQFRAKSLLIQHWTKRSRNQLNKRLLDRGHDGAKPISLHEHERLLNAVTVARLARNFTAIYLAGSEQWRDDQEDHARNCVAQWLTAAHVILLNHTNKQS